jgi:hypothetical protein
MGVCKVAGRAVAGGSRVPPLWLLEAVRKEQRAHTPWLRACVGMADSATSCVMHCSTLNRVLLEQCALATVLLLQWRGACLPRCFACDAGISLAVCE